MDICNTITCPDGNCPGCKEGKQWCLDPRCDPYCANCSMLQGDEFIGAMVTLIIVVCLMALLFIVVFLYGPSMVHIA